MVPTSRVTCHIRTRWAGDRWQRGGPADFPIPFSCHPPVPESMVPTSRVTCHIRQRASGPCQEVGAPRRLSPRGRRGEGGCVAPFECQAYVYVIIADRFPCACVW